MGNSQLPHGVTSGYSYSPDEGGGQREGANVFIHHAPPLSHTKQSCSGCVFAPSYAASITRLSSSSSENPSAKTDCDKEADKHIAVKVLEGETQHKCSQYRL